MMKIVLSISSLLDGGVWLTTQSKVLTIEDQFQFGNQNKKKKKGGRSKIKVYVI